MNMKTNWILLFSMLLFNSHSTLTRRNNTINSFKPESWISDTDLTTIISLSFPTSSCCNVYLSGPTEDTEPIFRQFRRIYQHPYLLNESIHACQAYFILGTVESQLIEIIVNIQSDILKTDILVMLAKDVGDSSALLNVKYYGNSHTNILSPSGMWTLSENYLVSRVFKRTKRYGEMIQKKGMINMRGRELQVVSYYSPPSSYLNKTFTKTINQVETEVFTTTDGDGIEYQLFLIFADKLNFTWIIRAPWSQNIYGIFGSPEQWNGSVIGMVHDREVHMAFAAIWMFPDRANFANMSHPWCSLNMHFLVPRPRPLITLWSVVYPFSSAVWITLIALIFLQTLSASIQAQVSLKYPQRWRHFVISFIEMIGRLLGTTAPQDTPRSRPQMLLWHIGGLLIVTGYCSNLAAILATSNYEKRIDTFEDFVKNDLTWGGPNVEPSAFQYMRNDEQLAPLVDRYVPLLSVNDMNSLTGGGKFSVIGNLYESYLFPHFKALNYDPGVYRRMKDPMLTTHITFALQPWLIEPINNVLLIMRQTGIVNFHMNDVLRRRFSHHHQEFLREYDQQDGSARVLTLYPLAVAFFILFAGILISTVVFFFEYRSSRKHAVVRRVLNSVEGKSKIL